MLKDAGVQIKKHSKKLTNFESYMKHLNKAYQY